MIAQPADSLGNRLRQLRLRRGVGIKGAAPALGVCYSYLSKIENQKVIPSDSVIERMAAYYHADAEELFLLADRIPEDVKTILRNNPQEALRFLRQRFGGTGVDNQ
jgi:transcriptional regulator with XRE-family HTH domain